MPRDKHVRAVAAEVAAQDTELLKEFSRRARWGGGEYAVAYAVLRFGETLTRLIAAACQDAAADAERQAVQPAQAQPPEASRPEPKPEAAIPEPAVIEASAPKGTTGKRRPRASNGQ